MQPLYSVDHETRQNSNRIEQPSPSPQEDTPLLHRFPPSAPERSLFMTVAVSLLLLILLTGVIIGIYLLILQNNAENILPPVDTPLQLVSRKQWALTNSQPVLSVSRGKAKQVIVVQTDTEQCLDTKSCADLLQTMETEHWGTELPYNFLVSTNGQTYASLGWHRRSPLFAHYPDSLVLAFIGNFTGKPPVYTQMDEAKNFFAESVSQLQLDADYVVAGKSVVYEPIYLYSALKSLPQWKGILLD